MIIYVYSENCSLNNNYRLTYIKNCLVKHFSNIIVVNYDSFKDIDIYSIKTLIFSGGDGIFNHIINICHLNPDIIYGYIPLGTANDIAHNINLGDYKEALNKIINGQIKEYNLIEINNSFFFYALSIGNLSDVSIKSKKISKKVFHKITYKIRGLKLMFKPKTYVVVNNIKKKVLVLLVCRTKYLGGTRISKSIPDELEIIEINNVFGLLKLFVFKRYQKKTVNCVRIASEGKWCVDGEAIEVNNALIKVSNHKIKIFN